MCTKSDGFEAISHLYGRAEAETATERLRDQQSAEAGMDKIDCYRPAWTVAQLMELNPWLGRVQQDSPRPALREHYDVLLLDYIMPRIDGMKLARHLRELGYTGLITGQTGSALEADAARFVRCGAGKRPTSSVWFDTDCVCVLPAIR